MKSLLLSFLMLPTMGTKANQTLQHRSHSSLSNVCRRKGHGYGQLHLGFQASVVSFQTDSSCPKTSFLERTLSLLPDAHPP